MTGCEGKWSVLQSDCNYCVIIIANSRETYFMLNDRRSGHTKPTRVALHVMIISNHCIKDCAVCISDFFFCPNDLRRCDVLQIRRETKIRQHFRKHNSSTFLAELAMLRKTFFFLQKEAWKSFSMPWFQRMHNVSFQQFSNTNQDYCCLEISLHCSIVDELDDVLVLKFVLRPFKK